MTGLRYRYASLNAIHYEAGWTDSWVHIRCYHKHSTLIDAARCGMLQPGFYVLAVDGGSPRQLTTEEDEVVNRFRFAGIKSTTRPDHR
jgi:hypothetical protein